jgi:acetyl esterase/lipase
VAATRASFRRPADRRDPVWRRTNYRLRPAARWPDHVVDVKKVIAWLRQHGPEHGADPDRIFLAGGSSGAQLAAVAALTPSDPRFQPGFEDADTSVCAAIALYGYYGWGVAGPGAVPSSPLAYVRAEAPPFFVAHGDRDTQLPASAAREFVTALRERSLSPVVYAELPGAQHQFDLFHSVRCTAVVNGIEAFAAWVLRCERPWSAATTVSIRGLSRQLRGGQAVNDRTGVQ